MDVLVHLGLKPQARRSLIGKGVTVWMWCKCSENVDLKAKSKGVKCVFG